MMISCLPQRHARSFLLDKILPEVAMARNKATSLCGRSAGRHISPQHLKKKKKEKDSSPHPSRLCPGRLYCDQHHPPQTALSKQTRCDFHRGEVSEKQTDAPALVCDGNSTLKVKGTRRLPDNVA